ncbi:MAG: proline--tRNA ligase [bacterium]|nr:proline--tRNA ligase [bacterium]
MRWSQYYLYTTREVPKDAEVISHQLMTRAGMIKKLAAGIYTYTPFGFRSISKMMAIVRRELDRAGAMELSMPAVQPAELWQESGRWQEYGKELLRMRDRHDRDFCFGPTHEEVITDMVRHDVRSYKQLPINLYQIQVKFRDEIRPRFGLMRGREFLMKDAYSFHADGASLDATYQDMRDAYCRIFEACGLDYTVVEADSGTIGGSSSHEFMVLAQTGESAIVRCDESGYAANTEKAEAGELPAPPPGPASEETPDQPQQVATPGLTTVEEVAEFLGVEPSQMLKTMIYTSEQEELVAVAIRGDREINEVKLANHLDVKHLALASEGEVTGATGAPVGFAGPVGLTKVSRLIADHSVRSMSRFVCGANAADAHLTGVEWGRDAEPTEWADLLLVGEGDPCPSSGKPMTLSRGIEVGHIFKLGDKYSKSMGCQFLNDKGQGNPMIMGCYGLGIGRTVAAAIEQGNDADGIIWPRPLAPFEVLLIALNPQDDEVRQAAEALYGELQERGVEVLYDDRKERPGVKFKDADLIGVPVRLVVGKRGLTEGKIEFSLRANPRERHSVDVADAAAKVGELLE